MAPPKRPRETPLESVERLSAELAAGTVSPAYLLHGEEELLIRQARDAIRQVALGKGPPAFNLNVWDAAQVPMRTVIETAQTLPMMSARRLIVVQQAHQIKEGELAALKAYLARPSPTTVLVAVADRLKGSHALKTLFSSVGTVLELRTLYEGEIPAFIQAEARRLKKNIPPDAVRLLAEMVGSHLGELRSELEKAALYVGDRDRIEVKDLEQILSDVSLDNLFDFIGAVGTGQLGPALAELVDLGGAGQRAPAVLAMLQRHFNQLLIAKEKLSVQGASEEETAAALGVADNLVWRWKKEFLPQVPQRSMAALRRAQSRLYLAQRQMRSALPAEEVLHGLVVDLCMDKGG